MRNEELGMELGIRNDGMNHRFGGHSQFLIRFLIPHS